jgi:hypothetical protein
MSSVLCARGPFEIGLRVVGFDAIHIVHDIASLFWFAESFGHKTVNANGTCGIKIPGALIAISDDPRSKLYPTERLHSSNQTAPGKFFPQLTIQR